MNNRQTGRTTQQLKRAAQLNAWYICMYRAEKNYIESLIQHLKLDIPRERVLCVSEFLNPREKFTAPIVVDHHVKEIKGSEPWGFKFNVEIAHQIQLGNHVE